MELEGDSRCVMLAEGLERSGGARGLQPGQALVSLPAAPVIQAVSGEQHISESQFCLREVAADKVGFLRSEALAPEAFRAEQQTRAAVQQQPRRFVQGYGPRITVLRATRQQRVIPHQPAPAQHQVVVEHRRRAATQLVQR